MPGETQPDIPITKLPAVKNKVVVGHTTTTGESTPIRVGLGVTLGLLLWINNFTQPKLDNSVHQKS